ncbi:hypothetical protein IQ254_24485 [Nodosilinea sp. LEGE 07088]|uniref:hypothetical protein n=1 Tax=Nodosilinea sp. LEGE 07088 TaxID=2777968 RepID=UPI0018818D91|nr:hypothetical protein [Nodosilinea sp. LEGE 07088]MBE9140317.1 hypothetical protein [Nodosilinea sp. LEGE 07088]
MCLDDCLDEARKLRAQGCNNDEILEILRKYCKHANEADRALKALQKEERERFKSK